MMTGLIPVEDCKDPDAASPRLDDPGGASGDACVWYTPCRVPRSSGGSGGTVGCFETRAAATTSSLYLEKPGRVTVKHPSKDLPIGTLRSIYRQAQWNWEDR
jgi:hypothetical protein